MGGNVPKAALKRPKPTRSESVAAPFRFVSITPDGDIKERNVKTNAFYHYMPPAMAAGFPYQIGRI
jgi:hypothetical protein